ncbi:outer membrane beta-barrel protein [bacterium]|nr:outer membrane beta-barrel protein [bacterium]
MKKINLTILLTILCLGLSSAQAGFYVRPTAGAVVPLSSNQNTQVSLGVTAGYQFVKIFAVEGSYSRFLENDPVPAANAYRLTGIARVPTGVFAPYASLGTGFISYDLPGSDSTYFTSLGAGVTVVKLFMFSANVGVEYLILDGADNLLEPRASIGVHF